LGQAKPYKRIHEIYSIILLVLFLATNFEELREKMLASAREGIKEAYSGEEYALIQAINAQLETSKSYNLAYERLTEWAGIYAPDKRFNNPKSLAEYALSVAQGAESGSAMGRKMNEDESKAVAEFAEMSKNMDKALTSLDGYIKAASNRLLPNTTYLTDEHIAAELLSRAGSMERLATMPASTVQLLGAEKSLFKHLKFGSKPPKYGVLFKLPIVNTANRDQRGRIARAYATKICIALKADHYTKKFIAKELKKSLDDIVEKIKSSPPRERPKETGKPGQYGRQGGQRRPQNRTQNRGRRFPR
jgi:nucleolar protein 56